MTHPIAFLVYNGVDLLDLAGVYAVLAQAGSVEATGDPPFSLHTVARTKEVVTCYGGLQLLPDHIYPDAHIYDAIVIPGGPGCQAALQQLRLMNWIERAAQFAQVISAVGTGVYLLAAARLLNGRAVAPVDGLTERHPSVQVVSGQPLVRSGNVLTIAHHGHGQLLAQAILQIVQ
ncbi:MAG: DJ-1/PfpI family protein [Chloroflexi bacterium]|nr:DJ-1/PfpI family protein [Chloroflexota bacterium]MCI0575561.1 DJ-1/PfpI family protein [Chloroflexota bacterium]MCI0649967.1 DJ-1/PfpI family protein [Chloroflexota bacterium]MCI0729297.1 DJ-1/PfpI family protein [Chloroflexota bacterium]